MTKLDLLLIPVGDHDKKGGYAIDGSKVQWWATRGQALTGAKACGWTTSNVVKVHTRFQIGYALSALYGERGLLSKESYAKLVDDRELSRIKARFADTQTDQSDITRPTRHYYGSDRRDVGKAIYEMGGGGNVHANAVARAIEYDEPVSVEHILHSIAQIEEYLTWADMTHKGGPLGGQVNHAALRPLRDKLIEMVAPR